MKPILSAKLSEKSSVLKYIVGLLTSAFMVCTATNGLAQGTSEPSSIEYDLSVSAIRQPEVNIDGGGKFSLSGGLVRFGLKRSAGPGSSIGLGLSYDVDDYDFTGITEFGGEDPWNDVRRVGISLPYFKLLNQSWAMGLSPSVNWLQESGAASNDSLSYGITGFATRSFTRTRSLGFGAGVFRTIDDETDFFPFIAIDWQFNDQWRLSNPFDADALGPAGLELSYRINDRWQLGGGGVYRSFRFRLDNDGVGANGIGENKSAVAFLRLRRFSPSGLNVDFYAGTTLAGELELDDTNGRRLAVSDYDNALFVALTLSVDF
jgi:hypothetical protein